MKFVHCFDIRTITYGGVVRNIWPGEYEGSFSGKGFIQLLNLQIFAWDGLFSIMRGAVSKISREPEKI